jgi:hypothetical protein
VAAGGSGGGTFGLVLSEIRGFCIAFSSTPSTDAPLWVRLDDPNGPFSVQSFTVDRGRTYELDRTDVGTAEVTIIDTAGYFDPTNPTGPFVNLLNPMKPAALAIRNPVTGNWSTIFRGFTERFEFDMYPTEGYMTVTCHLVDGMGYLSGVEVVPSVAGDGPNGRALFGDKPLDYVGDQGNVVYDKDDDGAAVKHRIDKALTEAGWPTGLREVFSGNVSLKRTVYAPRSPLMSVINDAADAEFPAVSNFYFQKDGRATFHGRMARFNDTDANYHISHWKAGDLANVTSDPTRALIFDLKYDRDKDKIYNSILITPQDMDEELYEQMFNEDVVSIANYGRHSISFENLILNHDFQQGEDAITACLIMSDYYVFNYANPKTRVNTITLKGRIGGNSPYSDRVWRIISGVDISDVINVKTTHAWGGGFDADFFVEGVHYEVAPQSDEHLDVTLTLDLSPKSYYDDHVFG